MMTNLLDELNIVPRSRITIPENHTALIVPIALVGDIKSLCLFIRRGKRFNPEDKFSMHAIAGELLLAIVDAEER